MRVLYSASEDARGEIAITATKEEWAIIAAVLDGTLEYAMLSDDLLDVLQSVGVTY